MNFETANVRSFYENNKSSLYEKTPINKKLQIKMLQTPSNKKNFTSLIKKDLFSELVGSDS